MRRKSAMLQKISSRLRNVSKTSPHFLCHGTSLLRKYSTDGHTAWDSHGNNVPPFGYNGDTNNTTAQVEEDASLHLRGRHQTVEDAEQSAGYE